MATYAKKTDVSAENSRMEIERTLTRYGADSFGYASSGGRATVGFSVKGLRVRFEMTLPESDEKQFTHYSRGGGPAIYERTAKAAHSEWQQAVRQRWRALALAIKAKLEAVESGIATFEDEFLAYMVLPNGDTVGKTAIPALRAAAEGKPMPPLLGKF